MDTNITFLSPLIETLVITIEYNLGIQDKEKIVCIGGNVKISYVNRSFLYYCIFPGSKVFKPVTRENLIIHLSHIN